MGALDSLLKYRMDKEWAKFKKDTASGKKKSKKKDKSEKDYRRDAYKKYGKKK